MGGMCGRYASIKAPADLAEEFRAVDATGGAAQVDYNVAPTKQVIANHYCMPLHDELFQCVVTDTNKPGGRIIGIEYIVSDRIYQSLDDAE